MRDVYIMSLWCPTYVRESTLYYPKIWKDIKRIDDAVGNIRWQNTLGKEVATLIIHKCFDFKTLDYKPPTDYQFCRLHLVYDIKHDLTYKPSVEIVHKFTLLILCAIF